MAVRLLRVLAAAAAISAGAAAAGTVTAQTLSSTPPPGAEGCGGCHGPVGRVSSMPSLTDRSAEEIFTAMQAFREGARPATLMDRIAKGFDAAQTAAIAAWIAEGGR
jgi:cytochrome subunit of sulfide dehydrogenase